MDTLPYGVLAALVGLTGGVVYLDGQKISLLSQPIPEDAERVASVLRAIRAAVPDRLTRLLDED